MDRLRAQAVVLAVVGLSALLAGCTHQEAPPAGFPPFDADLAMSILVEQVTRPDGSPRYRIPGTEGRAEAADLIADRLRGAGVTVERQRFDGTIRGEPVAMENVVGIRDGAAAAGTVYLAAHYDSRPWADRSPDPGDRDQPVLGANDGASGTAVLLAVAHAIEDAPLSFTIRFLFFDGEDLGTDAYPDEWIQGSTHYASTMTAADVEDAVAFILLDMVGDHDLTLKREGFSSQGIHRPLQDLVWETGKRLGHDHFVDAVGPTIIDDHRPFQARDIRAVDVIHLDDRGTTAFPESWHTTDDTPGRIAKESLAAVGETVLAVLWEIDAGKLP